MASGHYSDKFRPHDTMHLELTGFDFQNGIYYYNVGEGLHRNWDDFRPFGFISAGYGVKWHDAMSGFRPGDIVAAYLKKHGYVGIGQIKKRARPIREVIVNGKPLLNHKLRCKGMAKHAESDDLCEYVALVEWICTTDRAEAKWKPKAGIYTTTHIRASLDGQPKTVKFLEEEFGVNLREYVT